jgi:uncharacterized protein (DUF169 family)
VDRLWLRANGCRVIVARVVEQIDSNGEPRIVKSKIATALKLKKYLPVAVLRSNVKPEGALQFKEARWGCVAAVMVAASKGRTAVFDRHTFGCVGGGTGLGFGDQYKSFPIEYLLSTGNQSEYRIGGHRTRLTEGEGYFRTPDLARKFVDALPMRDIPEEYVVLRPLAEVNDADEPSLVMFLANPDQLSALMVLANYSRADRDSVVAPFGAGCQSILFGFAESERTPPRAVIGFTDISVRKHVDRDILSFTVPWTMFQEMENIVAGSFLEKDQWLEVAERLG